MSVLPASAKLRTVAHPDFIGKFSRQCPGHAAFLILPPHEILPALQATVRIPCAALAEMPWTASPNELPQLAEFLREADLRECYVGDWNPHRYAHHHRFIRDLIQERDAFGPIGTGTPDLPTIEFELQLDLRKTWNPMPDDSTPQHLAFAVGYAVPRATDLLLDFLGSDTPLTIDDDVRMHGAFQWPIAVHRVTLADILGVRRLPDCWENRIDRGLYMLPANGVVDIQWADIYTRTTVQTQLERPQADSPAIAWTITIRGVQTLLKSCCARTVDGECVQDIFLQPVELARLTHLELMVRRWCRRSRFEREPIIRSEHDGLRLILFNGPAEEATAEREALDEFMRFSAKPQHANPAHSSHLFLKAALTARAVELASGRSPGLA